jgi:hypothetical protein
MTDSVLSGASGGYAGYQIYNQKRKGTILASDAAGWGYLSFGSKRKSWLRRAFSVATNPSRRRRLGKDSRKKKKGSHATQARQAANRIRFIVSHEPGDLTRLRGG